MKDEHHNEYSFTVIADIRYLKEWQQNGIEIFLLENSIPIWAVNVGLTKVYCFFQDIVNFKNPFKNL
jgi:hypothetical protein